MIDSFYRAPFQRVFVDPIARRLSFHPHMATFLSLTLGLTAAFFIAAGMALLGALFFLLSGYFDVLDGTMARLSKRSSSFGAVLDLVSDRAVEFAILFALYAVNPAARGAAALWMLGSMYLCVASFFSVSLFTRGESEKSFVYSPGLVERTETFVVFTLMILWPASFSLLSMIYTAALFLTVLMRLREFRQQSL